jgi:hypothetical protein
VLRRLIAGRGPYSASGRFQTIARSLSALFPSVAASVIRSIDTRDASCRTTEQVIHHITRRNALTSIRAGRQRRQDRHDEKRETHAPIPPIALSWNAARNGCARSVETLLTNRSSASPLAARGRLDGPSCRP